MTKREKTLEETYRGLATSGRRLGYGMCAFAVLVEVYGIAQVVLWFTGVLSTLYLGLGIFWMALAVGWFFLGRDYIKTIAPGHERTAKRMKGLGW